MFIIIVSACCFVFAPRTSRLFLRPLLSRVVFFVVPCRYPSAFSFSRFTFALCFVFRSVVPYYCFSFVRFRRRVVRAVFLILRSRSVCVRSVADVSFVCVFVWPVPFFCFRSSSLFCVLFVRRFTAFLFLFVLRMLSLFCSANFVSPLRFRSAFLFFVFPYVSFVFARSSVRVHALLSP